MPHINSQRCQRGIALLELIIALAVSIMVLIWASNKYVHDVEDAASTSAGVWLLEIKKAMDQMLLRHFQELTAGQIPKNESGQAVYANALAPTLAELKQQRHLAQSFPEASVLLSGVTILIERSSGCPDQACRLDAWIVTQKPMLYPNNQEANLMRIATVLEAAQGYGGSVSNLFPNRVKGANFDVSNPPMLSLGVLPVGTVVMWSGLDNTAYQRYVLMRDSRDPDFQGQLSVAGNTSLGKNLSVKDTLTLENVVSAGATCSSPGQFARNAQGELMFCSDKKWKANMRGEFGGGYSINSIEGCQDTQRRSTANPLTNDCSCPKGYVAVLISSGGVLADDGPPGWTRGYLCIRS